MAEPRGRPTVKEIQDAYNHFIGSSLTLAKIKDAALGGRLFPASNERAAAIAGRSFAWKLFLLQTEPLQLDNTTVNISHYINVIRSARQEYKKLVLERMRAPDGSYDEGLIIPGTDQPPPRTQRTQGNLDQNNPLSLHDENPWTIWFTSMELRKTILQDVERTFPDIDYFRDPDIQAQLSNILFVYSITHPAIGYRQGMHELLALLYYAIDFDSLPENGTALGDIMVQEFCSRAWVAADAWVLFSTLMQDIGRWYEWREAKDTSTSASSLRSQNLQSSTELTKSYVAPIVEDSNRIQSTYLKTVDPQLWKYLQSTGIEPQIYGIRWLRLLFTREFGMDDAMTLWDGLFAFSSPRNLAPWVCVAMLLRIRSQLIPADYSTQLSLLLRYPSLLTPAIDAVDPMTLLLRQAVALQIAPSSATGASLILENHTLLNIPAEPSSPMPSSAQRRPRLGERGSSFFLSGTGSGTRTPEAGGGRHVRQGSSPMALPEMFARNLLEKGESLGINKTVMNAVSELKRNLPDISASIARLPISPNTPYGGHLLWGDGPSIDRTIWDTRGRLEAEKELAELRSLQRHLGESIAWILTTLSPDGNNKGDDDETTLARDEKHDSLEYLTYVRDVLQGVVAPNQVQDEKLFGEEELKRRKARRDQESGYSREESTKDHSRFPPLSPQSIAATYPPNDLHRAPQMTSSRRPQDYFPSAQPFARSPPRAVSATSVLEAARSKAPSPTPTVSILSPNANALPLFSLGTVQPASPPRNVGTRTLSKNTVRQGNNIPLIQSSSTPQTPREEPPSRAQPPRKGVIHDPLGAVLP